MKNSPKFLSLLAGLSLLALPVVRADEPAAKSEHQRARNPGAMQERAVQILKFKLDILWAMNDAMGMHYGGQHFGTNGVTAERKVA